MLNAKDGTEVILNLRALQLIENAFVKMLKSGCRSEHVSFVVYPQAEIASYKSVRTRYGEIRISSDGFLRKGLSYLIEDPGRKSRAFAWVSGYKPQ